MLFEEYGTDHFQTIAINHTGAVGLIIISPTTEIPKCEINKHFLRVWI